MPAAELYVVNGTVVSDGAMLENATVHVDDGRIVDVDERGAVPPPGAPVLDADGGWVLPGIVNGHAHGCTTGPLFSSAAPALSHDEVLANADRHLRAGVTTLVNVCGFDLPAEVPDHPMQILLGTTHLPHAVEAARLVDGSGLDAAHAAMTAERLLADGAVALGEIGSGATLGGGVAAYRYVPDALERELGVRVDPATATDLIDALVGRERVGDPDDAALSRALGEHGLSTDAAPTVRAAILEYAVAPVRASLASFAEAAAVSERTGAPVIFHAAEPSVRTLLDLARTTRARIIAGHMNHTSLEPQEAVELATQLREAGAVIDVSSLDIVHARQLATPEVADALASAGLVDTLTTDYAGGAWEPMLALVRRWADAGLVTLAQGVAMCTSTPARALGLADRGVIARGRRADIVISDRDDVSDVRVVLVGGRRVVG